jgi:hypothetical protein
MDEIFFSLKAVKNLSPLKSSILTVTTGESKHLCGRPSGDKYRLYLIARVGLARSVVATGGGLATWRIVKIGHGGRE